MEIQCSDGRGSRWRLAVAVAVASLLLPVAALAHTGADTGSGFAAGFRHPLGGIDHVLAMLAVGMWGAQLGAPALWVLPVAFPMMMSVGAVLGILGLPLPGIEAGIAASVVVLGAMIAGDRRPALPWAFALVAVFALFHGNAHGLELPGQAGPVAYSLGFVVATGMIHLAGIGIGLVTHLPHGLRILRAGGSGIALVGLLLAGRLAGLG